MPNYARLFREAVVESQRDYYWLHPELMVPGYWRLRLRKQGPLIPARTYLTDAEPGNPENVLDRWPIPFLAGEILGEVADPLDIFAAAERQAIRPLKIPAGELSVEAHYEYLVADALHAAEHRPFDPLSKPLRRVDLTKSPPLF